MKVIAVIGSPHADGPSTKLALEVLAGARAAGHTTVVYRINEMNIKGCQGCRTCKERGIDCMQEDSLKPYWKDLHEAGALVLSAPNYCSQICGPMITYMNRHYCLLDKDWKCRLHPGVKLVGVFSQGGSEINDTFRRNIDWFLSDFQNRKMALTATIIHCGKASVEPGSDLMREAFKTGQILR
jgi:multimeric flavodoxin WrbA